MKNASHGTVMVKDINPSGDSTPADLFVFHPAGGTPVLTP